MAYLEVLAHLQNQFSGQLVLYVDDLAKVLGKSDKAVANLIARDGLPFNIKTIGAMRCVSVYEVAQWLSSDQGMAQESVAMGPVPSARGKFKPFRPLPMTEKPEQLSPPKVQAPNGKFAPALLAMRHRQAKSMGRFVQGLRIIDDVVFMNEVMEKLFYTADLLAACYVVTVRRLALKDAKVPSGACQASCRLIHAANC